MSIKQYEDINMNPDDYPVTYVVWSEDNWHIGGIIWGDVNLHNETVLRFEEVMKWGLKRRLMRDNPTSPYPYLLSQYTGDEHPRIDANNRVHPDLRAKCPWIRSWKLTLICFLQAHARKLQKWWRSRPTEVAMPCAEEVE